MIQLNRREKFGVWFWFSALLIWIALIVLHFGADVTNAWLLIVAGAVATALAFAAGVLILWEGISA